MEGYLLYPHQSSVAGVIEKSYMSMERHKIEPSLEF